MRNVLRAKSCQSFKRFISCRNIFPELLNFSDRKCNKYIISFPDKNLEVNVKAIDSLALEGHIISGGNSNRTRLDKWSSDWIELIFVNKDSEARLDNTISAETRNLF